MKKYDKLSLTFEKQIDLLQSRGLIIKDKDKACKFLSQINYYRFTAYCLQFEEKRDKFKSGTSFEQILQLYEFDRSLRFLIDEALEVIEIAVRTATAYHLSHKYGPFMHEDVKNFYSKFDYNEWIENVHKEAERSREKFVLHYKDAYDGFPSLPLWMVVEIMSFGSLSKLVSGLYRDDQIAISSKFELHHTVLLS